MRRWWRRLATTEQREQRQARRCRLHKGVAILTEPLSCITKSLRQADLVQARLELWEPKRALVTGASTIGLLVTMALRQRGIDVTTYGRRQGPYRNSELIERLGARYVSATDLSLPALAEQDGRFDIVFEGSGAPALIEDAVAALAPNGVTALFSVTPSSNKIPVDMARLNQSIVGYNRVLVGSASASWDDFTGAVATLGQVERDEGTRGWLGELITDRIEGLDAKAIADHLAGRGDHIKTTVEVAAAS